MITKTEMVKKFLDEREYKKALAIAKDFRIGFTKEEKAIVTRAYECLTNPGWYAQLGKNEDAAVEQGIQILRKHYQEPCDGMCLDCNDSELLAGGFVCIREQSLEKHKEDLSKKLLLETEMNNRYAEDNAM